MPPPSATYREWANGYRPFFPPSTIQIFSVSRVIIRTKPPAAISCPYEEDPAASVLPFPRGAGNGGIPRRGGRVRRGGGALDRPGAGGGAQARRARRERRPGADRRRRVRRAGEEGAGGPCAAESAAMGGTAPAAARPPDRAGPGGDHRRDEIAVRAASLQC